MAKKWKPPEFGEYNQPPIGMEVKSTCRGKAVTAVVAGSHYLARKGKRRELALRVTGDEHDLDRNLTVLVSMTERRYWRVEAHTCVPTGTHFPDTQALERLAVVKSQIDQSYTDAREANEGRSEIEWWRIDEGAVIQVKFRDIGWQDVEYAGTVQKSGNVRYKRRGRTRTTGQAFARLKAD
jgi:hypothetical protein